MPDQPWQPAPSSAMLTAAGSAARTPQSAREPFLPGLSESDAMKCLFVSLLFTAVLLIVPTWLIAQDLKVGAAAEILAADDAMVIGGGIGPGKARGQEGELRALQW